MRERRWGPRLGLGSGRVDPERARFGAIDDVLRYFSDRRGLTHAQLAARCGVGRVQMTRWLNRDREPALSRLAELLEPLGWKPVIMLERTETALDELIAHPEPLEDLLEYDVHAIVTAARNAIDQGLDVVVGGEAAAVLQGIPVPTRHLRLHVHPDHLERFLRMASRQWLEVDRFADAWAVRHGPVSADVLAAPVRPATRIVTTPDLGQLPVVDIDELLAGSHDIGPSVRRAAGRLIDRAG